MTHIEYVKYFSQLRLPEAARVVYAVRTNGTWCVHWVLPQ